MGRLARSLIRRSLPLLTTAALAAAVVTSAAASPALAASCPGTGGGHAPKSQGAEHRAPAAVAALAARCPVAVPTPTPTPAPRPTPVPTPTAPPPPPGPGPRPPVPNPVTNPVTAPLGGPVVALPIQAGGPVAGGDTAGGSFVAPPAAGLGDAATARTVPGAGGAQRRGSTVGGGASPGVPALASIPSLLGTVARVAYVMSGWEEEMLLELELLFAALAILFIALWRRREQVRLRNQLAASAGVPPSALVGIPSAAASALLTAIAGLADRSDRFAREALLDELTGIYRRGPGMDSLLRDVARAERALVPQLTVAMVDVDGLKAVNDSAGHAAGDDLLRAVAGAIAGRLRGQDLVFRYGGDEFVCVFPNTDAGEGWRLLDQICSTLSGALGRRAFSFGVAQFRPGESAESLLERADRALYAARGSRS